MKSLLESSKCKLLCNIEPELFEIYHFTSDSKSTNKYLYENSELTFIVSINGNINVVSNFTKNKVSEKMFITMYEKSEFEIQCSNVEFVLIKTTFNALKEVLNFSNESVELFEKSKNIYLFPIEYDVLSCINEIFNEIGKSDFLSYYIENYKYLELVLLILRSIYINKEKSVNPILTKTVTYINANIFGNVDLDYLAKDINVSKSYICNLFKKYYGKTIISYVNEIRIEKACELLKEERLTVNEISSEIGFNSINYFYKVFKSLTGNVPKKWLCDN